MLTVTHLSRTQYLVSGVPGRSPYIFRHSGDVVFCSGVAGDQCFWLGKRGPPRLELYAASSGELLGSVPLTSQIDGKAVVGSRDGRRLYIDERMSGMYRRTGSLTVVDAATAIVVARHDNIPAGFHVAPVEREDGLLVLKACKFAEGGPAIVGSGAILLDPLAGVVQQDLFDDLSYTGGLWHPSPDGHYWLRPDKTCFPIRTVVIDGAPRRIAALRMQLWESFPFRFVRTITLGWLTFDRLPGLGNHPPPETSDLGRCYEAISETLDRLDLSPTQGLRESDLAPTWKNRSICMGLFSHDKVRIAWEPSGQAFWADLYPGIFIRAEVSGRVSPQMRLAPTRRHQEQARNIPKSVEGLPGARARLNFEHGTAVITPPDLVTAEPYEICTLPASHDGWIPADPAAKVELEVLREQARRGDRELRIPLASWGEADCVAAIDQLTSYIEPSLMKRIEGELCAVFELNGEDIGEDVFFERVAREHPSGADAIARLVEAVCTRLPGTQRTYVFWPSENGNDVSLFGHAVKALATRGWEYVHLIRLYAIDIDEGHDSAYWGKIAPTLLAPLDEEINKAIDFLLFVIFRDLEVADPLDVWRKRLGKLAKLKFEPEPFARHVLSQAARYEKQEQLKGPADETLIHGAHSFDRLANSLGRHNPDDWELRFFAELKRLHLEQKKDSLPR